MESLTIVCAVLSITINLCRLKDSVWMGHFANRMEKLHFLPPWSIWWLIHHPLFAAAKRRQSRFCRTSDLFIIAFQSILIHSFPLLSIPISNLNFHLFIFKLQTNHRISKDWTGALCLKILRERKNYEKRNVSSRTKDGGSCELKWQKLKYLLSTKPSVCRLSNASSTVAPWESPIFLVPVFFLITSLPIHSTATMLSNLNIRGLSVRPFVSITFCTCALFHQGGESIKAYRYTLRPDVLWGLATEDRWFRWDANCKW